MRFHCLGIQHTATSIEYLPCAFTQKVLKFCKMMTDLGHTVIHYGNEASEVVCSEHVTVTTLAEMDENYKHKAHGRDYWKFEQFEHSIDSFLAQRFHVNSVRELRRRIQKNDFVLAFWGTGHQRICDEISDTGAIVVEPGIGYPVTFSKYRVFESYAKLHLVKGQWDADKIEHYTVPNWTDEVIPNYFDPSDFEYKEEKEDYLFFIGRLISTKGLEIAMRLAAYFDMPLKVAGQGDFKEGMGWEPYDCVEMVGSVGLEERKALMSNAKAGICASLYIEPFCGTHIEFGMSGTPVLTTDWGVFVETIAQGENGWRCRSFEEFVEGFQRIDEIKPQVCRDMAMNYSLDRVGLMYHHYFDRLLHQINAPNFWSLRPEVQVPTVQALNTRKRYAEPSAIVLDRENIRAQMDETTNDYYSGGAVKGGDPCLNESRIWDYCIHDLLVRSVLDIGAGEGHTAKYFAGNGVPALAIDSDVQAIENGVFPVMPHDLTESAFTSNQTDLAYMAEFVEHLPEKSLPHLAQTLTQTSRVLMTFAEPGVGGIGHVNCQSEDYWIETMSEMGFIYDAHTTRHIRELAMYPHFKQRALFFVNEGCGARVTETDIQPIDYSLEDY